MKMAYSGTSGRMLSNIVSPKEYCRSWKKPAMRQARRMDRQEARRSIRRTLEEDLKREQLTNHIRRQEAEWKRLFALMDEM